MKTRVSGFGFTLGAVIYIAVGLEPARSFAAPPTNDNFADATPITGLSGSVEGSVSDATTEAGDSGPVCSQRISVSGGGTVWYSWTAPSDLVMNFRTDQGDGTSIEIYTGTSLGTLTFEAGAFRGHTAFNATVGRVYHISVCGSSFSALSWTFVGGGPGNDNLSNATSLTGKSGNVPGTNVGATEEVGEIPISGRQRPGAGHSVWYSWLPPFDGVADVYASGSPGLLRAVYVGENFAALELVHSDPGPFSVRGGTEYKIAVDSEQSTGFAETGYFTLSWSVAPPPANDNFANAAPIEGQQGTIGVDLSGATIEAGEVHPQETCQAGSVWYRWTAPRDLTANFFTHWVGNLPVAATGVAIYTGDAVGNLTVSSQGGLDAPATNAVVLFAQAGHVYHIAVLSCALLANPPTASLFTLSWTFAGAGPANDNFQGAEPIDGQTGRIDGSNVDATFEIGEPISAGDSGVGGVGLRSVWYSWVAPTTATVVFTTEGSSFDTTLAIYVGEFGNLEEKASNDDFNYTDGLKFSVLSLEADVGQLYQIRIAGFVDDSGLVALSWGPHPANDRFADAQPISGDVGTIAGTSIGATKDEEGEEAHGGNFHTRSIWYRWTAPRSSRWTFDTLGTVFRNVVAVYEGNDPLHLSPVLANDSAFGGVSECPLGYTAASVVFPAQAGVTYQIAIDHIPGDPPGPTVLSWALTPPNDDFA